MNICELMDQAKTHSKIESDNQLAKTLGLSQGAIWQWRNSGKLPTPEHAHELAKLAGKDPAGVVAEILIMSTKHEGLRQTLDRFKRALAAAAGVLPALLVAVQQCILCKIDPIPVETANS